MLVKIGNNLFHYRNFLFPVFYAVLLIPSPNIFPDNYLALIIGLIIIIIGIGVRAVTIGLVYIIRGGSNRKIYAERLVTEGIYKICRNPMYLGNIVLITGFGVFANSLLFSLILVPLFFLFYLAIIKAEEDFLIRKFGFQFVEYRNSSNALFPKFSLVKQAFQGHQFNFKRVINKEHNSLFLYLSGILLLLWYKYRLHWYISLSIFIILLLTYLYIKLLKKKKKL